MKKLRSFLLYAVTIAFIVSCQNSIVNNSESIKLFFNSTNFTIKIENRGCFVYSESSYNVTKQSNGYFIECKETEKSKLIPFLKMDSLKDFLVTRKLNKPLCKCSTMEYIKLSSDEYSVDYSNRCCSGKEATFINDFLGYYELSSQD